MNKRIKTKKQKQNTGFSELLNINSKRYFLLHKKIEKLEMEIKDIKHFIDY